MTHYNKAMVVLKVHRGRSPAETRLLFGRGSIRIALAQEAGLTSQWTASQ